MHSCTRAHPPTVPNRAHSSFCGEARNERPSSSVELEPQLYRVTRGQMADQAGSKPGQPRSTLISSFAAQRCDFCWETQGGREKAEAALAKMATQRACVTCATCSVRCASHRARACTCIVTLYTQALCAADSALPTENHETMIRKASEQAVFARAVENGQFYITVEFVTNGNSCTPLCREYSEPRNSQSSRLHAVLKKHVKIGPVARIEVIKSAKY